MGYKIGLPSMKLNNRGFTSKHCGCFDKAAREALEERIGKDSDIDRSKTYLNIIEGYRSVEELEAYSVQHIAELTKASGKAIRKDAVVMCVTIIKPPAELMAELIPAQQQKFLEDAVDFIRQLVGEENIKSVAYHYDELVPHVHILWEPMTKDGRLCAKEMHSAKTFLRPLNKGLPEYMRQKGWTMVDDCEAYDAAKEQELREELGEKEYAKQRAHKKSQRGRDSKTFKYQQEQERKALEKQNEQKRAELEWMSQQLSEDDNQHEKIQSEVKVLRDEKSRLTSDIQNLQTNCDYLTDRKKTLKDNISTLQAQAEDWQERAENARKAAEKAESRIIQAAVESIPPRPPVPPPVADWDTWQEYNKPQRRNLFDDGTARVRKDWERLQADHQAGMQLVESWDETYQPMLVLNNALVSAQAEQSKTQKLLDKEHTRRIEAEQQVHTLSLQRGELLHELTGDIPEGQRPIDNWYQQQLLGLDADTLAERERIADELEKESNEKENCYDEHVL